VLDPDVVLHVDASALPTGRPAEVHGASAVARRAMVHGPRARGGTLALVNGRPGLMIAPFGKLRRALAMTFANDRIVRLDLVADPERLSTLEIATLDA
jgi:RNA polymerase sigma-70 factor (ECF subfamily)